MPIDQITSASLASGVPTRAQLPAGSVLQIATNTLTVSQQEGLRERPQRSQTVLRYLAFHLHQHLRQTLFLFKQAPFQFQKKVI